MVQKQYPDRADPVVLPPLIYGAALLLGLIIQFIIPVHFLPRKLALSLGIPLILVSIAISMWAFRTLARAKTTIDVRKSTTAIVIDGPFRFSRNPLYLSGTLFYLGLASVFNSLWLMLLVIPLVFVIRKGVVEREENYLERKFGEEYLRYKNRVGRWL